MPGDRALLDGLLDPPSPSEDSKRHPKLWFDDGSLIIQASSTRYRIHRSIICQHSAIFRDMMALPQPGTVLDNENTFDVFPLLKLEDSADDLSALLEALYNLDYFQELKLAIGAGNEDFALQSISGVLRLSIKYEFRILRKKAIQVLEKLSPTTLKGFKDRCTSPIESLAEEEIIKQMEHLFSIIELSKSCGLSQFLPSALYRIARLLAPDGSQDHLLINSSKIDVIHKVWCLSGRTRFSQIDISADKELDANCLKDHTQDAAYFLPAKPKNGRTLFSRIQWEGSTKDHCKKCALLAWHYSCEGQQRAWNLLPDYFGFQGKSWAKLKRNDMEAMND